MVQVLQITQMLEAVVLAVVAQNGEQVGLVEHRLKALYLVRQFTEMLVVMVLRTVTTIMLLEAAALLKRVDGRGLLMEEAVLVNYFLTLRLTEQPLETPLHLEAMVVTLLAVAVDGAGLVLLMLAA